MQFDVVLTNPPYIPSMNSAIPFYGDGGDDGEDIIRRIFNKSNLSKHLRVSERNATICMVANLMNVDEYPQKLRS